jgi:ClpX C4-type zinc finger
MKKIVIESPLAGDFARNKRYALWCARHCYLLGEAAYASHLLYPQFLDDQVPEEREFGIEAGFAWADESLQRVFYTDLGWSPGMKRAADRFPDGVVERQLPPELLAKFEAGEVPPMTSGFSGTPCCSFCGKPPAEVDYMVAKEGSGSPRPMICNECVWISTKHMVAGGWKPPMFSVKIEANGSVRLEPADG